MNIVLNKSGIRARGCSQFKDDKNILKNNTKSTLKLKNQHFTDLKKKKAAEITDLLEKVAKTEVESRENMSRFQLKNAFREGFAGSASLWNP